MMLKRFMFMLVALLLTVSSALAQAIAPRCRVCGRKLTECPYKGKHTNKNKSITTQQHKKPAKKKKPTIPSTITGKGHREIGNALMLTYEGATIPRYLTLRGDITASDIYEFQNNKQCCDSAEVAKTRASYRDTRYNPVSDCFDLSDIRSYNDNERVQWTAGDTTALDFLWLTNIPATTVVAPQEAIAIRLPPKRFWVSNYPDTLVIGRNTKKVITYNYIYNDKNVRKDGSWDPQIGCLKAFRVDEKNPYLKAVDGVLYSADETRLIAYPGASERTEYTIPSSVKVIEPDAFAVSNNLKRIICNRTLSESEEMDIRECCAYLEELIFPQQ